MDNALCAGGPRPTASRFEKYGRTALRRQSPLARVCSTKALLGGDGDVVANLPHARAQSLQARSGLGTAYGRPTGTPWRRAAPAKLIDGITTALASRRARRRVSFGRCTIPVATPQGHGHPAEQDNRYLAPAGRLATRAVKPSGVPSGPWPNYYLIALRRGGTTFECRSRRSARGVAAVLSGGPEASRHCRGPAPRPTHRTAAAPQTRHAWQTNSRRPPADGVLAHRPSARHDYYDSRPFCPSRIPATATARGRSASRSTTRLLSRRPRVWHGGQRQQPHSASAGVIHRSPPTPARGLDAGRLAADPQLVDLLTAAPWSDRVVAMACSIGQLAVGGHEPETAAVIERFFLFRASAPGQRGLLRLWRSRLGEAFGSSAHAADWCAPFRLVTGAQTAQLAPAVRGVMVTLLDVVRELSGRQDMAWVRKGGGMSAEQEPRCIASRRLEVRGSGRGAYGAIVIARVVSTK